MLRLGILAAATLSALAAGTLIQGAEPVSPVYELRIYTCEPGKLTALNERFRNHTLRLFARHGMVNLGYWIPTDEPQSETTLVYLLQHASEDAAAKSWAAFRNDPEWQAVAKASQEAHGKILAKSPESIYFTAAAFSPSITKWSKDAVFELRTYVCNPGKLPDLHARFQNHTLKLFERQGMTNLWYLTPLSQDQRETTLVYFLAHESREAAQKSWEGFLADPEWQAARNASEAAGPILAKRPDAMFLRLADYSPTEVPASN